ncbi:hypothetical protein HXX76_014085 [Chlamydomonas incerta]|uniref:Uncharacterized protein n=1 Tax=Chlamydomonas incerta TaxID=51695 RepID=A0A835SCU1_CHLIN|nr:hypothetical protein HXX76_014085 [Chlamydomonas incerta]|eukprot:KAG2424927.1 hypothetical protein HXX76_014085 [Chlamydomonas incerta]
MATHYERICKALNVPSDRPVPLRELEVLHGATSDASKLAMLEEMMMMYTLPANGHEMLRILDLLVKKKVLSAWPKTREELYEIFIDRTYGLHDPHRPDWTYLPENSFKWHWVSVPRKLIPKTNRDGTPNRTGYSPTILNWVRRDKNNRSVFIDLSEQYGVFMTHDNMADRIMIVGFSYEACEQVYKVVNNMLKMA